jgi:hypothetical protein
MEGIIEPFAVMWFIAGLVAFFIILWLIVMFFGDAGDG